MTKEQAIQKAADWWYSMIRSGTWDNGDADTELSHSFFKSMGYQPTSEDYAKLKAALPGWIEGEIKKNSAVGMRTLLYSDYGCYELAELYKKLDLKMNTSFHCPQKAGTEITEANGEWTVKAKCGYGGGWEPI